jgi:TRAP-type C4-dicarboxylate transport system permease small subunit
MPRSPEAGGKVEQKTPSRRTSPALILAAVICVALLLAYLGNAAWNLMRIGQYDVGQFLAAATIPFPLTGQSLPQWVELASAVVFLLIVILTVITLRAAISRRARRDKSAPYAVAETADIFVADKTRITARPAPIASPKPVARDGAATDA